MTDEVVIISPELSPGEGGVGDYTLRLIESVAYRGNLKLLIPETRLKLPSSLPHPAEALGLNAAAISKQLPSHGGKVLLQYSAYGFDRIGYPRHLIRALIDWKRRTRGLLVVMFHEIWTFWPSLNKNAAVQLLHRRAIKRLVDRADTIYTTTTSQAQHLSKLTGSRSANVLPVGSNIRRIENVDGPRKSGLGVLFGLQRARIRALQKMQSSLRSLAAAGQIAKIVTIGGADTNRDETERRFLADLGLKEGFEQRGRQNESDISKLLLTAAFGISAQDQLSYGKSGTFMAYAAHGLNILSECADLAREEPLCLLIAPRELLHGLSESELGDRANRLRAWQQRTSSWELIAAKLADALQLSKTSRAPAVATQ